MALAPPHWNLRKTIYQADGGALDCGTLACKYPTVWREFVSTAEILRALKGMTRRAFEIENQKHL